MDMADADRLRTELASGPTLGEGIEAAFPLQSFYPADDVLPSELVEGEERRDNEADRKYDELDVVRQHDGEHAAEDRVEEHQGQQPGHDPPDDGIIEVGDLDYEGRAGLQEEAHIEDSRQRQDESAEDANPAAEAPLVELGDGHDSHPAKRHDDEAAPADHQADDACADGDMEGRKAGGGTDQESRYRTFRLPVGAG